MSQIRMQRQPRECVVTAVCIQWLGSRGCSSQCVNRGADPRSNHVCHPTRKLKRRYASFNLPKIDVSTFR